MSNVEKVEAGSQLLTTIITRNNLSPKSGQNDPSEDQAPDFLTDFLSKLCGEIKQGSEEGQANSGEWDGLGQESLKLGSVESVFPIKQLGNTDSEDQTLGFSLETTGLKDQIKESGDEDQENKTVWSPSFPPLESLFIGKEGLLEGISNKTEDVNSGLSNPILLKPGEDAVTQPDGIPVEGALAGGKGSGEGSPGAADPKGERPINRPNDTRIFFKGAGPNSSLSQAALLNGGENPVSKHDRSPVEGTLAGGKGSGEGSPGAADPEGERPPIERPSDTKISLQEAGPGPGSSLSQASLFSEGADSVLKSEQSPVEGAQPGGKGSGEGSPGSVNSTGERPVERPERKGSLDLKDGLKPHLDDDLLLDKLKTFVEKISQSLADGPARTGVDSEGEKTGFKKSIEPPSGKDNFQKEGSAAELRIHFAQDRQSSNKIMIEKAEWAFSEKGKEGQPGLFLLNKEGFPEDPKGLFAVKDREGPEIIFDIKGLNNNEVTQSGENLPGNNSRQAPILPTVPHDPIQGEPIVAEKSIKNNQGQFHHFPKTYELDFLKDHYFSVKKQTSSSMEISLEPAGLGKLDIELNLNQDRLQGQIMVNDKAGKELIERNLPQLLSDLAREGLQVGGFSVSLKHQGRGQNPVLTRTEFEEPSLGAVSPEKMVPIQGNHLIHIIV
jgi:hypothetical protein